MADDDAEPFARVVEHVLSLHADAHGLFGVLLGALQFGIAPEDRPSIVRGLQDARDRGALESVDRGGACVFGSNGALYRCVAGCELAAPRSYMRFESSQSREQFVI